MKRSASESKPFQSRSIGEILGQARRKERLSRSKLKQVLLSDSDVKLFMYLIQCIRLGLWKVRSLNQALEVSKLWSMVDLKSGCVGRYTKTFDNNDWGWFDLSHSHATRIIKPVDGLKMHAYFDTLLEWWSFRLIVRFCLEKHYRPTVWQLCSVSCFVGGFGVDNFVALIRTGYLNTKYLMDAWLDIGILVNFLLDWRRNNNFVIKFN